ncbi:MAG: HTH domain-containing protein [Terrisporobacter sp.]
MREKIILQKLIESKNYITAEEFSEQLNVSTRTIRSHMRILIEDGKKNGFTIILKRGKGYYIQVLNENDLNKYIDNLYDYIGNDREKRLNYVITTLFESDDYITMESLAENLMVSRSVIKGDLEKIQIMLDNNNINLDRKSHYGIKLSGDENDIRQLILDLALMGNESILKLISNSNYNKNIIIVEKSILSLLNEKELLMNEIELKSLIIYLKIILFRMNIVMEAISEEEILNNNFEDYYYEIGNQIVEILYNYCNAIIKEEDKLRIIRFLKKKSIRKLNFEVSSDNVQANISCFLESIDLEYKTRFNVDEQLKEALLFHTTSLLQRLQNNVQFLNPIVNEISYKYPELFNLAIRFAKMIESEYSVIISKDEIGYITMHLAAHIEKNIKNKINNLKNIAVICSSGGGVALLIKLKLETLFSSSTIKTFSLIQLEELKSFKPSIIFSISELKEEFNVPVIYIKELLEDNDILRIKEKLELRLYNYDSQSIWEKLLSKDIYFVEENKQDYNKLLKKMGRKIESLKYAEKGYLNKVIERESVLSTIYSNGIVIPHPMEMCGLENKIGVTILKKPIFHEGKEVRIIFMISLKKGELELHKIITKLFLELMSSKEKIDRVTNCLDFEDFIIEMNNLID